MDVTPLDLSGLKLVRPRVFGDERGFFLESYNAARYREAGIDVAFVQDNHSRSVRGTLRGLHFQKTQPQAKLVRAVRGRVFDVAVDLRKGSPTFGRWHGVVLDDEARRLFFIPAGFAHGFLALSDGAEFAYKCSDYYLAEDEGGVLWNDPDIGIDWPLGEIGEPLLSEKDKNLPRLKDLGFSY